MAWKEMKGSRKIEDRPPHYIDYIITFTGAQGDAVPTGGQLITNILGSGTLPNTNLAYEPEVIAVGTVQYATPNYKHVTVRFRGVYSA